MRKIRETVKQWIRSTKDPRVSEAAVSGDPAIPHPLRLLAREGGYRALKLGISKLVRGGALFHYKPALLALQAEILWANGDHPGVCRIANTLVRDHQSVLGHFYLAQSAYVRGDRAAAEESLRNLLAIDPKHTDGIYLMATCAMDAGDRERAWRMLENTALTSSRAKTWLLLAQLVESKADLARLFDCHARAREKKVIHAYGKDIADHLALGALRGGDCEKAKSIWRDMLLHLAAKPGKFGSRKRKKADYTTRRAERALVDLKRALEFAEIEMFLVSGTLLGCIREGRLLSHDKDIDVGIWEDVPAESVRSALRRSGLFTSIPSRSPQMLRVRHVNGIPLDLFYHFREPADCWHGGIKLKWHNSPFALTGTSFLNETFLVPADHDLYLTENYGDWRIPKTDFDSAFDTPNGEVIHQDELVVHSFKMLLHCHLKGAASKVEYYLGKLCDMGESEFAAAFRKARGNQTGAA